VILFPDFSRAYELFIVRRYFLKHRAPSRFIAPLFFAPNLHVLDTGLLFFRERDCDNASCKFKMEVIPRNNRWSTFSARANVLF